MNIAAWIWLVLVVLFLATEAGTVSLVSIWFAGGALAAMVSALLGAQVGLQVLLFLAVSAILLTLLRPILRKFVTPKQVKTNIDAVIGSKGIVLEQINNDLAQGRVKLGAMEWTARSTSGEMLEPGIQVVVDTIEGVKVFVSPVQVREPIQ